MAQDPVKSKTKAPAIGEDVTALMPPVGGDVTHLMGGGLQAPPSGRGGGPGPMQAGLGGANPNERIGPNVGGFIKENLPLIGGIMGSGAAFAATGGMSLPVQIGAGLLASGAGAGTGEGVKYGINSALGIPVPPTMGDKLRGMGEAAVVEGMGPEAMGHALGGLTRVVGGPLSRIGARGRNRATAERISNPQGMQMSPGAREVGKQTQIPLREAHNAAKDPLERQYDTLLKGPLGQARKLEYTEGGYGEPIYTRDNAAQFTMQEAPEPQVVRDTGREVIIEEPPTEFTVTERGPTFAQRHQRRSDALEDSRAAMKRDDPKAARRDSARAAEQLKQMEQAALDNGLSLDEYRELGNAWAAMSDQFDNTFMRQARNLKGSNFIDLLLSPKRWKTRMGSPMGESGVQVPLDNPELLRNLKINLENSPGAYARLQTAVQKAIVRRSTDMHGDIVPKKLATAIRNMVDYGAGDLVPNHRELLQMAQILDKHAGGPLSVPRHNTSLSLVDRLLKVTKLDNALTTPDVARTMKLSQKGGKGTGQKLMEWLGRLGTAAGMIDEPPPRP